MYDGQIAEHAPARGHFAGKTAEQIKDLFADIRANGEALQLPNGNVITLKDGMALFDDVVSDTSAGSVFRPDNLKDFVRRYIRDNQ